MMKESNQRGGSIIEVLVMSGAMAAMMVGFMSLLSHEAKSVTYLEDKLSRVALENELRMQFSNPQFCEDFLKGLVSPLKNKTKNISNSLTGIFQKRGNKTVYDQLEIKKISLEGSDLTAPNSSGTLDLVFYPERMRVGGGPPSLQPIKIKTTVTVGAGYKIESCGTDGEQGQGCKVSLVSPNKVGRHGPEYEVKLGSKSLRISSNQMAPEGAVIYGRPGSSCVGPGVCQRVSGYNLVCINGIWAQINEM